MSEHLEWSEDELAYQKELAYARLNEFAGSTPVNDDDDLDMLQVTTSMI